MARLPPLTPEQRSAAMGQFERANEAIASRQLDYARHLLFSCCKLDPGNLVFRQALRRLLQAEASRRSRGPATWLSTWLLKAKLKTAKQTRNYLKVLDYGERLLARQPADSMTSLDMAGAAEALGLLPLGVWLLEQAWKRDQNNPPPLSRALARLLERNGNYAKAGQIWNTLLHANPSDVEAHHKAQSLAAKETIARGRYEAAAREIQ